MVKRLGWVLVVFGWVACNNTTSIDKTIDSTKSIIDSQKYVTRDSVTYKADSNKQIIDSTFKVMKDSMKRTK